MKRIAKWRDAWTKRLPKKLKTKDALKQKNVPDWMRKRGDGNGTNASTSNAWRNYMEMT
jgi:hypothetical protein